ncbi:MAG: HAMP domain-containing protein, partial [Gammaproteobacteria bacterium]|nr:HAMP domain-containing protein [Gammaproteobacteria bacterium]
LEGIDGLKQHISDRDNFPPGQTVYLINSVGKDLLDRPVPQRVLGRSQRIWSSISDPRRSRRDSDRTARWIRESLLVTDDGEMLLAMPGPAPPERFGFLLGGSARWAVLGLAAAISLVSFWLLSRSLTRPVARISETASRLAAGDMTSRVGESAYTGDEIGQLAEQFDRMADELDQQSKTRLEMFRNIAHELRAPLTRLQIASELLQRKPDSAEQQIERIQYEIERVEGLATQVLNLARAEKIADTDETTSLNEVVHQIIDDAKFEAGARNVLIQYSNPAEDIVIKGSPVVIASAIENVVRNAIQIAPTGTEVAVSIARGTSGSVTVSDEGPGVPSDLLDKIFEPFYRIDTNRAGAGIGLAISKRVLQQLRGDLAAVNRPDGGLQITMRFPLAVAGG